MVESNKSNVSAQISSWSFMNPKAKFSNNAQVFTKIEGQYWTVMYSLTFGTSQIIITILNN